ncbi:hypothetical protein AYI70_g4385 [Smittium culicis]|uniref:Uncharacterized protein n=1 Tax=Smittium culicis TaxID=133412 RepID=A0A1R1XZP2_9FUNG|nr:hypothetical protein AYI70_g4385 [Smittium culicis]
MKNYICCDLEDNFKLQNIDFKIQSAKLGGLKFRPEETLFLVERGAMSVNKPFVASSSRDSEILDTNNSLQFECLDNLWILFLSMKSINLNQYQVSHNFCLIQKEL